MSETVKILVADDEEVGRQLLEAILLPEGYDIVFGSNGQEALNAAIKEIPDIILLDVMMPVMDGYEACRSIREHAETAHIPVYLITALDDRDSRIKGIDSGADDYISKPFDRVEILGKIKNKTNLIRKQKIRTASNGSGPSNTRHDETRSTLRNTMIRQVLPQPFSKNILVAQTKEVIASRHAFIQKSIHEDDYFLLLSNKLTMDIDISVLANSILASIWEKVLGVPQIESCQTIKKSLVELDDLKKRDSLEILSEAGYSILQIYHAKGSGGIRISGINQQAFILLQEKNTYQAHSLSDNQEFSFSGPGSLIAFSEQVFGDKGEQEILGFLNAELAGSAPEKILTILQDQYANYDDRLTIHYGF